MAIAKTHPARPGNNAIQCHQVPHCRFKPICTEKPYFEVWELGHYVHAHFPATLLARRAALQTMLQSDCMELLETARLLSSPKGSDLDELTMYLTMHF